MKITNLWCVHFIISYFLQDSLNHLYQNISLGIIFNFHLDICWIEAKIVKFEEPEISRSQDHAGV